MILCICVSREFWQGVGVNHLLNCLALVYCWVVKRKETIWWCGFMANKEVGIEWIWNEPQMIIRFSIKQLVGFTGFILIFIKCIMWRVSWCCWALSCPIINDMLQYTRQYRYAVEERKREK